VQIFKVAACEIYQSKTFSTRDLAQTLVEQSVIERIKRKTIGTDLCIEMKM
jgi:hypothetical protein